VPVPGLGRHGPGKPVPRTPPAPLRCHRGSPAVALPPGIVGVCSVNNRQRDRMVATTSSGVGAQRIHTVRGAGSSILFSSASAPRSVTRSASSITITCHRPKVGLMTARRTSSRTSSTPIESSSVRTRVTSGCAPDSDVRHSVHLPATARAALQRCCKRSRRVRAT
jgi:hypothetical protein